jgi:uncharacterized membrane protein (DUF2068 family)
MNISHTALLRLIAVFKLLKSGLLIAAGIGVLKLIHANVAVVLHHWVTMVHLDPGDRFVARVIQNATRLSPDRIRDLGIVSFIYAALFLTEGIGLWLLKSWAEWFTVIVTGSLVPLEIYECYRHLTAIRLVTVILNIAVVAYLIYRITERSHNPRADRQIHRKFIVQTASRADQSRTR